MVKLAILGDVHIGMRNDSLPFYEHHNSFYQEIFFPYLLKHKIKTVLQTGDLFDRRKFVNFTILDKAKKDFFDWFYEHDVDFHTILGNHDIYYRNTLSVNSPTLLLPEYLGTNMPVHIIDKPYVGHFGNTAIEFIPWICDENREEIMNRIQNSPYHICFGHFELNGFEMDKGNVCLEGMDRSFLKNYKMVISGHFHHRSSSGNIHYVGTPAEMTFADLDDPKGFHVLDTETYELTFIENPCKMFHKIIYDDRTEPFAIEKINFKKYEGTYVKVVALSKTNPYLFDQLIKRLEQAEPIDVTIAENYNVLASGITEEDVVDAEDTLTILKRYVETMETENLKKDILYQKIHDLYIEAQTLEQI